MGRRIRNRHMPILNSYGKLAFTILITLSLCSLTGHSAWSESLSGKGACPWPPCPMIFFIPNVLKLNVLAAESSVSMRSSSSPRRLLIDLRCSVLLLLLLCPHIQYVVVLKFVTSYDVCEQISRQTNKLRYGCEFFSGQRASHTSCN